MTAPITSMHIARTADDADRLLSTGTEAVPLAGGTDLLVQRRSGRSVPAVVDLSGLDGDPVTRLENGALRLAATASLTDIAAGLDGRFPALLDAIAVFAAETIRNRATLGGNLATGSPAADTVPALLAADAVVELRGRDRRRQVTMVDFLLGPRRVDLRAGEWIESLWLPAPPGAGGMRKVAGRRAQAISLVSLAWQWELDPHGRRTAVRLAMGAVAPTVVRLRRAEAVLEGAPSTPEVAAQAAAAVSADIRPIDDLRAGADYRRRCAAGLLREVLGDVPPSTPSTPSAQIRSTHR
ncbi:FAD binding domain-containing protein [Nakamurella lactea]|uniref:FAD binding domain-containing protein n=1 Tax=Nakamurella lactea TaxID=459515 RepID=UPI000405E1EA|nr:FAD binding domain-containing protein [Nakamurella lactea]